MVNDLRLAVERLVKYPIFAAAVCLTLTVGIAATTTIAGLTDLLVFPLSHRYVPHRMEIATLVSIMTAAGLFFVVVCMPVANLVARQAAIRCLDAAAVGSPDRLIPQLLIEGVAHGLIGSALGIVAAASMTSLMRTVLLLVGPLGGHLATNWRAAAIAAAISAVSVTILCLLPAVRVAGRATADVVAAPLCD